MIKDLFKKTTHCSPIGFGGIFGWQNYTVNSFDAFLIDYKNFNLKVAIYNFLYVLRRK